MGGGGVMYAGTRYRGNISGMCTCTQVVGRGENRCMNNTN